MKGSSFKNQLNDRRKERMKRRRREYYFTLFLVSPSTAIIIKQVSLSLNRVVTENQANHWKRDEGRGRSHLTFIKTRDFKSREKGKEGRKRAEDEHESWVETASKANLMHPLFMSCLTFLFLVSSSRKNSWSLLIPNTFDCRLPPSLSLFMNVILSPPEKKERKREASVLRNTKQTASSSYILFSLFFSCCYSSSLSSDRFLCHLWYRQEFH